jgi:uncharacterized membrane protein YdfJ with MMPL/SSD domain
MIAVALASFGTSQVVFIKELGLGVAAAALIDAFVIRALLVPALMALLGERNWWSPVFLARLHRRIGVREEHGPGPATQPVRLAAGAAARS